MRDYTPSIPHFGLALLAALMLLITCACVPKKPAPHAPAPASSQAASAVDPDTLDPDTLDMHTAYSKGLNAFWSGDYALSALLFESMARRQDDQRLRSKALFGLACARLAAARTDDEAKAARAVWQEWERTCSGSDDHGDPRMLTPFIMNPKLFQPPKESRQQQNQVQAKPAAGDHELAKRLHEKEKEVLNLQKQIKDLEAISREIQAKKKMTQ